VSSEFSRRKSAHDFASNFIELRFFSLDAKIWFSFEGRSAILRLVLSLLVGDRRLEYEPLRFGLSNGSLFEGWETVVIVVGTIWAGGSFGETSGEAETIKEEFGGRIAGVSAWEEAALLVCW